MFPRRLTAKTGTPLLIREAAGAVQRPIFFSLLILIAAYIPLFALQRVEGRLFSPMAFTVCAALVGSLILTLTLVPVLATYIHLPVGGCLVRVEAAASGG